MAPVLVEMATLAGTEMGSVSLASSVVVTPDWPTMTILVPVAPMLLTTDRALA